MKKNIVLLFLIIMCINIISKEVIRIKWNDFEFVNKVLKETDIAGQKRFHFVDIVADEGQINTLISHGIAFEKVTRPSAKASFLSLDSIYNWMDNLHSAYPLITDIDTIGYTNVYGYPLKILKINGANPLVQEANQNGFLLMGCHHAREWQTASLPMFWADSILNTYASDLQIQDLIDSTFIIVFPVVNPDGYYYSIEFDDNWRKNRTLRNSVYGVDLNRNYPGSCFGEPLADWGFIANSATTHYPSSYVYCGPYPASEIEVRAVQDLIKTYNFKITISLHSYAEAIIWPWGSVLYGAPDSLLLEYVGTNMANRMRKQDGVSVYDAYQSVGLYPTSGDSDDWIYGYAKFILGKTILPFTYEVDVSFNNATPIQLDSLYRRVYPGILYGAFYTDSLSGTAIDVPLEPLLSFSTDTLKWSTENGENASSFDVYTYKNPFTICDSMNNILLFNSDNFEKVFLSGATNDTIYHAIDIASGTGILQSIHKFLPNSTDSIKVKVDYDLEFNYDKAFIEVSENNLEYTIIDTINGILNGSSSGWEELSFSLNEYAGKEIFIRIRTIYDGNTFGSGLYIDDIEPIQVFDTFFVLVDDITDSMLLIEAIYDNNYFAVIPNIFNRQTWLSDREQYALTAINENYISCVIEKGFIKLKFKTTSMENTFVIYKKINNKYEKVACVSDNEWIDKNPINGKNEYQVKFFQSDNYVEEKHIQIFYSDISEILSLNNSFLTMDLLNNKLEKLRTNYRIDIYDKSGRSIEYVKSPGIYFLKEKESDIKYKIMIME